VYVHVHGEGRAGRRAKIGLVQSFLAFLICATGGSLINSILLGTPIPVFNMASFPTFVACWAALTYSPRLYQLLTGIPFVNAQMALLASLNKATCVCSGVEAALRAAPGEYLLATICGVIASNGGGVTLDLFQLDHVVYGLQDVSKLELHRRLRLVTLMSLIHALSLSPTVLAQGPWHELSMLAIAVGLATVGLWASFSGVLVRLWRHPPVAPPKLVAKKRD